MHYKPTDYRKLTEATLASGPRQMLVCGGCWDELGLSDTAIRACIFLSYAPLISLKKKIHFQIKKVYLTILTFENMLNKIYLLTVISTTSPGLLSSFFLSSINTHFFNTRLMTADPNSAQYSMICLVLVSMVGYINSLHKRDLKCKLVSFHHEYNTQLPF